MTYCSNHERPPLVFLVRKVLRRVESRGIRYVLEVSFVIVSSLAMIRAAQLAPAVKLAPASYLEIASGAVIGIWIFGEYLDAMTIFGIAIIVAVCLTNSVMNELAKTRG